MEPLGLLVVLFVVLFLIAFIFWRGGPRVSAARQYPPISDEEFLAQCRPGTNPAVALKVRRIVADHFGVDYERIHPSTRFVDDLGAY